MTRPVRPPDPAAAVGDRPRAEPVRANLPVATTSPPADAPRAAPGARPRRAGSDYAAHVLGQDGRKRGLRGGPEVLDAAREAALRTEYSGPNDRRPKPGLVKRTEV